MNVASGIAHAQGRVAILFEGQTITYARLNEMANRAANVLQAMGVCRKLWLLEVDRQLILPLHVSLSSEVHG